MGRVKFEDLTGRRFGKIVVLGFSHKGLQFGNHRLFWECQCDCGNKIYRTRSELLARNACRCGMGEPGKKRLTKHGRSGGKDSVYRIWMSMNRRCDTPGRRGSENYIAKGIRVCNRWRNSFEAFLEDMGERPSSKHSIDRIDNDKSYSCGKCSDCRQNGWDANCRWATPSEQARNTSKTRMVTFNNTTKPLASWAEEIGITSSSLSERIHKWGIERAFTTPPIRRTKPACDEQIAQLTQYLNNTDDQPSPISNP